MTIIDIPMIWWWKWQYYDSTLPYHSNTVMILGPNDCDEMTINWNDHSWNEEINSIYYINERNDIN